MCVFSPLTPRHSPDGSDHPSDTEVRVCVVYVCGVCVRVW